MHLEQQIMAAGLFLLWLYVGTDRGFLSLQNRPIMVFLTGVLFGYLILIYFWNREEESE